MEYSKAEIDLVIKGVLKNLKIRGIKITSSLRKQITGEVEEKMGCTKIVVK